MSKVAFGLFAVAYLFVSTSLLYIEGSLPWQRRELWTIHSENLGVSVLRATHVSKDALGLYFYDRGVLLGCMIPAEGGFACNDSGDTLWVSR